MENQFFVDSEFLSPEALKRKHELETNPASRKNHMEYMPGMEIIKSDIRETVMAHVEEYDYDKYTARDVRAALDHETCSVEDFKALLSPAAAIFSPPCILRITARITVYTAASTAITTSTA